MAFLVRSSDTLINIKLTDIGRRRLAQGQLTFDKAVINDREVNYAFNKRYPSSWNLNPNAGSEFVFSGGAMLGPKDDHPFLPATSYDGSTIYNLSGSVHVNRVVTTAQTESVGLWSAVTDGTKYRIGSYKLYGNMRFAGVNGTNLYDGDTEQTFSISNILDGTMPDVGDLMYVRNPAATNASNIILYSGGTENNYLSNSYAFPSLWYRVVANTGVNLRRLDRATQFTVADLGADFTTPFFVYKYDAIDTFIGSAATVTSTAWNLNIVRTSREMGWNRKALGGNTGFTYANYDSGGYNGTKQYFGFEDDIRQVGFVHYSNENTGQTYWERFQPGTVELDLPDLMWHRTRDANDNFYFSGIAMSTGHRFTDWGSDIYFDETAQANYTLLKDRPTGNTLTVGRVYFDLKTIVITDPELLTAMTYKSNRNWTLPKPVVKSTPNPKYPYNVTTKPGFMKSNFNYYVTYLTYIGNEEGQYSEGRNFGLQQTIPCQYIQKVSGYTDENGNYQHMSMQLPAGQFPYMRTHEDFEALSGTGWGANVVQMLVQEVPSDQDIGIDGLHPGKWSGCSRIQDGTEITDPAGAYSGDENSGGRGINPTGLTAAEFIVSQADITSGTTIDKLTTGATNNIYTAPSGLTTFLDYKNDGLTLGSEMMLNGNVKVVKQKELYQSFFTMVVADTDLNLSTNPTYNTTADTTTYITEVGVLNNDNELVAVGKPNFPITRRQMEWAVLQLKLEF